MMAVSVHLTLPELGCIGLYIPSALGMSLGPQDVPRPSGHILGLGKSLGRQRCKCQYIPPLVSVCTFSLQISKSLWNNDDVDGENFNFSNFSERSRSIVAKIADLGPGTWGPTIFCLQNQINLFDNLSSDSQILNSMWAVVDLLRAVASRLIVTL